MKLRNSRVSRAIAAGGAAVLLCAVALLALQEHNANGAGAPPLSTTLASLHINLAPVGSSTGLISRDAAINAVKNVAVGRDAVVLDEELGVMQISTGPLAHCVCWVVSLQPADGTYTTTDGRKHQRTYTLMFFDAVTGKWLETAGGFSRS